MPKHSREINDLLQIVIKQVFVSYLRNLCFCSVGPSCSSGPEGNLWFVYTVTRLEEHNFDTTAVCSIGMHATGRPGGVVINLEYYLGVGSFDSPYSYGVFISRKTPAAESA